MANLLRHPSPLEPSAAEADGLMCRSSDLSEIGDLRKPGCSLSFPVPGSAVKTLGRHVGLSLQARTDDNPKATATSALPAMHDKLLLWFAERKSVPRRSGQ